MATLFTSKVPDFIRLPKHIPSLSPQFLNERKPKITCKLPLPWDLIAFPSEQFGTAMTSAGSILVPGSPWLASHTHAAAVQHPC